MMSQMLNKSDVKMPKVMSKLKIYANNAKLYANTA